jgi:hypothetical protein
MAYDAVLASICDQRRGYSWDALKERKVLREEFVYLAYKEWRYRLCSSGNGEDEYQPLPPLTEEEATRYREICAEISQADYNYWLSITTMKLRQQLAHGYITCLLPNYCYTRR